MTSRRFEMGPRAGAGAFGEVYRARVVSSSGVAQTVAVKILRRHGSSDALVRLRDEARLLAAVDHPVMLTVHDHVILDGRAALVSEYIDGSDLHTMLRQGPVPPLRVVSEVVARSLRGWMPLGRRRVQTGRFISCIGTSSRPTSGCRGTVR